MDGNKDESERCFAIAQRCIAAGHTEKAIKFLRKAERLYPSKKAQGTFLGLFFGDNVKLAEFAISKAIQSSLLNSAPSSFGEIDQHWIEMKIRILTYIYCLVSKQES